MSVHLATIDYAVIALFLTGILFLGFSAKLRNFSFLQYFSAGRTLTLPTFVATLVSTWYGGILGIGESVSLYGLGTWLLLGVPYYVFALIYALFFAERVRGADQLSIPERLEAQFGRGPALVGASLVLLLAVPAAHVLMLGVLVQALTGWGLLPCMLVGAAIGVSFLYKGGLLADARASLLAFVLMYVGFGIIAGWCLVQFPLGETLGKLKAPQTEHMLTLDGGIGPIGVFTFFILGAWTLVDPGFHQRVASCDSPRTGKRGVLVSIFFWMLFDSLTITTGMYAVSLLPTQPENPLHIFPLIAETVLPAGLKAMFLCGMFGTILSAMVGYTLVSGATVGREIVGRLKGDTESERPTHWSRLGILGACVLAIALGYWVESVVALWYSWAGVVIGAILLPVAQAYGIFGRWRSSGLAIAASMVAAALASGAWMAYGISTDNLWLTVKLGAEEFSLGTLIPGLAVSAVVLAIGELAGLWRSSNA